MGDQPSRDCRSRGRTDTGRIREVFRIFLGLGLVSFGGPVAHLGFFRAAVVERRRWLDEAAYADIVALCQFLPGPASSQVAVSLGIVRAGLPGGLAAWLGFTAPSAALLIGFGTVIGSSPVLRGAPWLHGLKIAAVAVVVHAVWGMARTLCPDRARASLAVAAALLGLTLPSTTGQLAAIALGGLVGWSVLRAAPTVVAEAAPALPLPRAVAVACLVLFTVLLAGTFVLPATDGGPALRVFAAFFRSGALVFGGGHVVLPLLQRAVVPPGWVSDDVFLAGYGAAQAVPGPLFTFAAFLGTVMHPSPHGWLGGLFCLAAIYLPSFLLLLGVLPFWDGLRRMRPVQAGLRGVGAAVVGLLLAALYAPVWTGAVGNSTDFVLVLLAFLALAGWKLPPWLVVAGSAAATTALAAA
ncbi:MAG: chromate efflux transporter [Gluconacetobacter diazotrophicus]|nr:chromate efflux transporter [Gluconacetobacter diazotrophicus]